MRLLLIRHGQTSSNVENLLDTAVPGPGLTTLGIEQAAALPEALAAEDIGVLYASDLTRAQLTATPLAQARGLPVHIRAGIREVTAGKLEMRGDRDSLRRYLSTVLAWSAGELALRMPGGDTGAETLDRFDHVVAEMLATGCGTAAMVSHGAAIRMWTAARAGNVDTAFAAVNPLSNTGMVTLEGDSESGWNVTSWTGAAIGGPDLEDPMADGPTASGVLAL
jgi:probable phosphoglycerate mutase